MNVESANTEQYFNWANQEEFTNVIGPTTGRTYFVRKYAYGVLIPNTNHALNCVSVSNSSLSIDPWIGCPLGCRYCHVQGTYQDLTDYGRMPSIPQKRSNHSEEQIVRALVKHPFFQPDISIISIGTASTEPFATPELTASTLRIMYEFIHLGFKNPFWIVTKAGIPKGIKLDLALITKSTKGLMVSICWADNPRDIEPAQSNRFRNLEEAKEASATICWYMRPIVAEWSGTPERLEMMMLWVKKTYGHLIDIIVPGGLRWTEGIEYGLTELHQIPMPNIPKSDNLKELPDHLWQEIMILAHQLFPGVPVFQHSSCGLSWMVKKANILSVQTTSRDDCENSLCPVNQRALCARSPYHSWTVAEIQERILNPLHLPARAVSFDPQNGLVTEPQLSTFTYAIRQTVLKLLSQKLGGKHNEYSRID